jgi:hypothetical protein
MERKIIILALYRDILRTGSGFKDYNFRNYILRRTKEVVLIKFKEKKQFFFFNSKEFRKHKSEKSNEKVQALIKEGNSQLDMLKRQMTIQNSFFINISVIENR